MKATIRARVETENNDPMPLTHLIKCQMLSRVHDYKAVEKE